MASNLTAMASPPNSDGLPLEEAFCLPNETHQTNPTDLCRLKEALTKQSSTNLLAS